ncbi:MAG: hypothetical protein OHK0028_16310 [Deltaproteobacteria bacterium]
MTPLDVILIGIPALTGGYLIASRLPRVLQKRSFANAGPAYRRAHLRMTEWMVGKRILRFPGACMIESVRPWGIPEGFSIVCFLVLAFPFRSPTDIARSLVISVILGAGMAWVSLRGAAKEAILSVRRDLPVACFLFSLLLESGMGAFPALRETSASIPEGPLGRELEGLTRSRSLGVPRNESIERSRRRVPVEEYHLFLNHVLQGERLGIGLSRSLRELSAKMLESQGHRAETIAQQAAVKMLIPLVCFIFPAVFLIILSPVILGLWDRFVG